MSSDLLKAASKKLLTVKAAEASAAAAAGSPNPDDSSPLLLVLPSTSDVCTPSNTTPPSPWMASTVHKKAAAFSRVRNAERAEAAVKEGDGEGSSADQTRGLPTRALMGVFTPPEQHAVAQDMRQLSEMLDRFTLREERRGGQKIPERHEQSVALEQSSFGILSAETLAEASALGSVGGTTLGASFAGFQNMSAANAPSIKTDDPTAVFKVPAARKSRKEANPNSLLKFAVDKNMKGSTAADWKEAPSKRLLPCTAKGPNLDLVSAETLSDASKIVNEVMGDSLRSEAPSFFREQDSAVFKVPCAPPPPARAAAPGASVSCSSIGEAALPTRFMTDDVDMSAAVRALPPGMLDTFMSTATDDASMANRSSFAWEKVVDNDVSVKSAAAVDPERPVGDETFDAINATGNSFCTGQFSARSTSFGGSNEGSSGRNSSRTRDEKFSDYTDASRMFAQEPKSGNDGGGGGLAAGASAGFSGSASLPSLLVNGPEGFVNFEQDFGEEEFGEEEFQTDGALDRIDADEKEFEEHNKLQIGQGVEGACSDGNVTGISSFSHMNFSFKPPSDASTDFLSRSAYFLQNTSKLGYLDTTGRPELRPDLGMGVLRSPESKRSAKSGSSQNSTFRVGSKNETYTLSSAETTLEQEKLVADEAGDDGNKDDMNDDRELGAKLSSFADLDAHSLRDLIAKASLTMDRDPAFYAKLIGDFHAAKARPAEAEVQNQTLNATSVSPFLPSFLETTCDVDITLVEEEEVKKVEVKVAEVKKFEAKKAEVKVAEVPKPHSAKPKSRIPRLSPAASKLPVPQPQQPPMVTTAKKRLPFAQLQQPLTAAAAKKRIRGQRFSSPIKDADADKAKGGPRAPTPKAVTGPAKKNLFSPRIPGKENQGTQVPTPTLTPSGGGGTAARRQPLAGENKRSTVKPAGGSGGSAARGRPREGVYLDKPEVFFPMTKAGKSSAGEIVVKNRTKCRVNFKCSKPRNPFDLRYEKFAVQPGSYTKLPVKYCPVSSGAHVATVELISEGKDRLEVTLRGRCI